MFPFPLVPIYTILPIILCILETIDTTTSSSFDYLYNSSMMWLSGSSYAVLLYNSNIGHTSLVKWIFVITICWSTAMRGWTQEKYRPYYMTALPCFLAGGFIVFTAWDRWLCTYVRSVDATSDLTKIWRTSTTIVLLQFLVSMWGVYCQDDRSTSECRTTIWVLMTINGGLLAVHCMLLTGLIPFNYTRAEWWIQDQKTAREEQEARANEANEAIEASLERSTSGTRSGSWRIDSIMGSDEKKSGSWRMSSGMSSV
jgi:hypothetical protein